MTQEVPAHPTRIRTGIACAGAEVLVIDDDVHFRELARKLLEIGGVRVLEAGTITQGLTLLSAREHCVDAVVLDLVLPDVDGIQAIRQIKSDFPGLRILTVSGADACSLYLSVSAHLGADAVLPKAQVEALPALLTEVLNR